MSSPYIESVQKNLTAVYTSTSEATLTDALNNFLQGTTIVLNGNSISLDKYTKVILLQRNFNFTQPSITFDKSLEVPTIGGISLEGMTSSVGIFLHAIVDQALPLLENPGGNIVVTSSVNAIVQWIIPFGDKEGSVELGQGPINTIELNQVMTIGGAKA